MDYKWYYILLCVTVLFLLMFIWAPAVNADTEEKAIILEVEGQPEERASYIDTYFPGIEVVAVYDTLLDGVALKAQPEKLAKIDGLSFVNTVHPSRTYEAPPLQESQKEDGIVAGALETKSGRSDNLREMAGLPAGTVFPADFNNTSLTGKNVTVGVIDTGIDYSHPDLQTNYRGGYDVVDLDDDPMESTGSPLEETVHGSHVAGIIAADGNQKGVAPDADIRAYRALGPGGSGSSVHILAALEKAVDDGVDIINLSLGNSVNGPDYPTSTAVNRAVESGVSVVTASGNDGPETWTVGSPATAKKAITVGASAPSKKEPHLYVPELDRKVMLEPFMGSVPWKLTKDHAIVDEEAVPSDMQDNMVLYRRGEEKFAEMAEQAQANGAKAVLIANNEDEPLQGMIRSENNPIDIPVAAISRKDGDRLMDAMGDEHIYADTIYEKTDEKIASFSSRGPVTSTWALKPEVLAPGEQIISTVPGGYQILEGTSMAAPHVTGMVALLKEAYPDWSPEQLKMAVDSSATPIMKNEGEPYKPQAQGSGIANPEQAVHTSTLIDDSLLAFGKINTGNKTSEKTVTIQNTSAEEQRYTFQAPENEPGVQWKLPRSFNLSPGEEKKVDITIRVLSKLVDDGLQEGYITLDRTGYTYRLPFSWINQTADYPKAMGLNFSLEQLGNDAYSYSLYLTDEAREVTVDLYDPDLLAYDRTLLELSDVDAGLHEGKMKTSDAGKPGSYVAVITLQLADGTYETYETDLLIDPA